MTIVKTKLYTFKAAVETEDTNSTEWVEDKINEYLAIDGITKENLIDMKFNTLLHPDGLDIFITVLVIYEDNQVLEE